MVVWIKFSHFILLLFYNCASTSSVYTNTWAVKMLCYKPCVILETLQELALFHEVENVSQVST